MIKHEKIYRPLEADIRKSDQEFTYFREIQQKKNKLRALCHQHLDDDEQEITCRRGSALHCVMDSVR
jgi:hypothetical protein